MSDRTTGKQFCPLNVPLSSATNPFNATETPLEHNALQACIDVQDAEEDPIHSFDAKFIRFLGYMLIKAPCAGGRKHVAEQIVACEGDREKLFALAESYLYGFFRPISLRYKERHPVNLKFDNQLARNACLRDRSLCAITKKVDKDMKMLFPYTVDREPEAPEADVLIAPTLIIPHFHNKYIDRERKELGTMYEFMKIYADVDVYPKSCTPPDLNDNTSPASGFQVTDGFHNYENTILLAENTVQHLFVAQGIWLIPQMDPSNLNDPDPNGPEREIHEPFGTQTYQLSTLVNQNTRSWPDMEEVDFANTTITYKDWIKSEQFLGGTLDAWVSVTRRMKQPDPRRIRFHRCFCQIMYLSGLGAGHRQGTADRLIRKLYREAEARNKAEGGSGEVDESKIMDMDTKYKILYANHERWGWPWNGQGMFFY
ncbi:hypothetical protein CVT24_008127 [Panaeolus cyanescens]|uniref:HNH nuclease domain-containing protein n=1 Tax=Panaeolus cyanescens TaxID=181874 RepID=A0A409YLH9_9AGAR|nr:hypothetical protein CVT24_008127 [Panaeolus cyanescens]